MRKAFTNCRIYTGEEILADKAVIIRDSIIEDIVDIDKLPDDLCQVDLGGANIAPGFIDLQVNGGGGFLFNDNQTPESILRICNAHKKHGTTSLLLTMITTSLTNMLKAIDSVKKFMEHQDSGVLGLHFEGPYISKDKAGVHDRQHIREASVEELSQLIEDGGDILKLVTVAPEVVDKSIIEKFIENDIVVSVGHTNASYSKTIDSFDIGINCATHLFNAMSQLGSREPGVVGAVLNDDRVYAGIIADGFHVDYANIKMVKKQKGNKLFLITDAMPPVGARCSAFHLGDLEINNIGGRCVTKDGTLAGSSLDMMSAVKKSVEMVGIPMDEALRMASTYPAELLRLGHKLGRVKPGYFANIVVFDNAFAVKGVVSNGNYEVLT